MSNQTQTQTQNKQPVNPLSPDALEAINGVMDIIHGVKRVSKAGNRTAAKKLAKTQQKLAKMAQKKKGAEAEALVQTKQTLKNLKQFSRSQAVYAKATEVRKVAKNTGMLLGNIYRGLRGLESIEEEAQAQL